MKKIGLLIVIIFYHLTSVCQQINTDLVVTIDDVKIEILKSTLTEIMECFKADSIVEIEEDGTYVLKQDELAFKVWDNDFDNVLDGIEIHSKHVKLWNGVELGMNFQMIQSKLTQGSISSCIDDGSRICYGITSLNKELVLSFTFDVRMPVVNRIYSKEQLEKLLQEDSSLSLISIYNPH